MRVALVTGRFAPERDGVADYVSHLARALGQRGDEVVVASAGSAPGSTRLASRFDLGGTVAAAGTLRRLRADVVHVHFAPSAYGFRPQVGLLPLLGIGAPLVTTLHEYGWWRATRVPDRLVAPLARRGLLDAETLALAPRSRALVVTGEGHAQVVRERLGREPVVVPIPAVVAVPTDAGERLRLRAAERARRGLPPSARLVVVFGFVHPVKGVRYLLEAVAALRREGRDVSLVVAGGFESLALPGREAGEFEAEIRGRVAALDLTEVVDVTGWLPEEDAAPVLLAADVAALPFTAGVTAKSSSFVACLAAGLPTVVTTADPPDPTATDGQTCVVVDRVRDADALAAGLARVLDDDVLAARLRRGAAEVAADRTWEAVAAAHQEVYAGAVR